ncbi:hypothetical protein F1559_002421 [Cyanidiococcus yangmingshanensis]|uniref:PHD-type domain-containing protein n=1 Tax=Cyanidiococcus yangmingshanensis TaxID=2690220 RepID=A0A7J7IEH1_9RHOD|nr:hypothetical protein F1559_002421 [Cyanidiococcus yangmingshanensis]
MSSRDTLRQRAVLDAVRALRHVAEQQQAAVLGEYQAQAAWLRKTIHHHATKLPERPYSRWEATVDRSTRDAASPAKDVQVSPSSSSVKLPVRKSTKANSSAVDASSSASHPPNIEIHHLAPPADDVPETWSQASLLGGHCNSASSVCGSEHDVQQRHHQATRVWDPRHSLLGLVQPPAASRKSLMLGARARRRRRLTTLHERKPRPSMLLAKAPSHESCAERPVDAAASVSSAIPAEPQMPTDIFAFDDDETNESAQSAVRSRAREAEGVSAVALEAARTPCPSAVPPSPDRQPTPRAQHRSIRGRKASRTTRGARAPPTHRERHSTTGKASAKTSSGTSVLQSFGLHAETIASPEAPLASERSASTKQRSPTDLTGSARRTADHASADQFEKPRLSRLSKSHSCGKSRPSDPSERPSRTRRQQQRGRSPVPSAPVHETALSTPRASRTPCQRPNNAAHRARLLALELLSPFSRAKAEQRTPRKDETYCRRCKGMNDPHLMLLCDRCDDCFHTYCCEPPFDSVPDDDWYCEQCIDLDRQPAATNAKPNTSRITPTTNQMASASPPSKPCQARQSRRTKSTRRKAGALARKNAPEMRATPPTANIPKQETAVRGSTNRTRQKYLRVPRAQQEASAPPTATKRAHPHRSNSEAACRSQSSERVPIGPMEPISLHHASIGTAKTREQEGISEAVNGSDSDRVAPSHQPSLAESYGSVSSAQRSLLAELDDHGQPSSPVSQPKLVNAVARQRSQRVLAGERQTPTRQSEEADVEAKSPALEIARKGPRSPERSTQSTSTSVRSRDATCSIAIPSIVPGAESCSQEPVMDQSNPDLASTASPLVASAPRQCANDHLLAASHAETGGADPTPLAPVSQTRTTLLLSSSSPEHHSQGPQEGYPSRESPRLSVSMCPEPQWRDAPRPEDHRLRHLMQQRLSSSMESDAIVSVATATAPNHLADRASPGTLPTATHPDAMIHVSFDDMENLSAAGHDPRKLTATAPIREHREEMALVNESGTTQTPFSDARTGAVEHRESSVFPTPASISRREKCVLERSGESAHLKVDDLSTPLECPNVGNASPVPQAMSLTRSGQALEECDPQRHRDDSYPLQMWTECAKRNTETGIPSTPQSVRHASCDGDAAALLVAAPINAFSELDDDGDTASFSGDAASSAGVGSIYLPREPRMVDDIPAVPSRSDEHHLTELVNPVQTGTHAHVQSHKPLLCRPTCSDNGGFVTSTQHGPVDAAGETLTSFNASADRIDADTNRAFAQAIFPTSGGLFSAPAFASEDIAPVLVDAALDFDNHTRHCASNQHLVGDGSHALVTCDQMLAFVHSTSERESLAMRSSPTERGLTSPARPVSGTLVGSMATAATSLVLQEALRALPFAAGNQLTPNPSQVSAAYREETFLGCDPSERALAAASQSGRSIATSLHSDGHCTVRARGSAPCLGTRWS